MYKYEKHDRSVTRSIQFCGKVGNSSFPFHHRGVEHNTTDKPANQPLDAELRVIVCRGRRLSYYTYLLYLPITTSEVEEIDVSLLVVLPACLAGCLMLWIVLGTRVVD